MSRCEDTFKNEMYAKVYMCMCVIQKTMQFIISVRFVLLPLVEMHVIEPAKPRDWSSCVCTRSEVCPRCRLFLRLAAAKCRVVRFN